MNRRQVIGGLMAGSLIAPTRAFSADLKRAVDFNPALNLTPGIDLSPSMGFKPVAEPNVPAEPKAGAEPKQVDAGPPTDIKPETEQQQTGDLKLAPEDKPKIYAAFFLGQGGYWFSWGVPYLARRALDLGIQAEVYAYSDLQTAWNRIRWMRENGRKIVLVGYSLGNTTATYLQKHFETDLLLAIAELTLGRNHPIDRQNTKRSVLWYGPDFLSRAGVTDGFDATHYVDTTHLLMDVHPNVVSGVVDELKELAAV